MQRSEITEHISDDKKKALELIKEVLGSRIADISSKAWDWLFINNPFVPAGEKTVFLEKEGERAVSLYGKIFVDLKLGNEIQRAKWGCCYLIHPEYRNIENASKMYLELAGTAETTCGFITTEALSLTLKLLNATNVGPIYNFIRILDTKEFFQKTIKNSFMSSVSRVAWDTVSKIYRAPKILQNDISILDITYFDERFDALWQKACKDYKIIVARTQKYLNWRFIKSPFKYKIFAATRGDELLGYLVADISDKGNFKKGLIVDLFSGADDKATINALINAALLYFKENNCSLAMCIISAAKASYRNAFRRNGFIIKRLRVYLAVHSRDKEQLSVMKDINNWFVNGSDPDLAMWD